MKGKRDRKGFLFVLPGMAGTILFWVLPYLDVLRRSFLRAVTGEFMGMKNYRTVLDNQAFRLAGMNTLRFWAVCIPLLVLISLLLALVIVRMKESMQLLKALFLLPMAIPVASAAVLMRLLFHGRGLFNHLLSVLSLKTVDWMNTDAAFWVLVFSYLWRNLGYDLVLWMAGLLSVPAELYEAAKTDGAGEWKCFWEITVPCLLPTLFTIVVLSFLNSFRVFREAYLVAGDYPQESIYLLQHLFNNWYRDLDLDKMAAGAVLTGGLILPLILCMRRMWEGEEG